MQPYCLLFIIRSTREGPHAGGYYVIGWKHSINAAYSLLTKGNTKRTVHARIQVRDQSNVCSKWHAKMRIKETATNKTAARGLKKQSVKEKFTA